MVTFNAAASSAPGSQLQLGSRLERRAVQGFQHGLRIKPLPFA
jgi:hypothetical protein